MGKPSFFKRKDVVYRVNGSVVAISDSEKFLDIQQIPSGLFNPGPDYENISEEEFNKRLDEVKQKLEI